MYCTALSARVETLSDLNVASMADPPRKRAKIQDEQVQLHNGVSMPTFGLGTYKMKGAEAQRAVSTALCLGYRLVDTASAYENERAVAAAVAASGVPRDQIFITTKVKRTQHGYERTKAEVHSSLVRLRLRYIDMVLIHWPGRKEWGTRLPADFTPAMRDETWRALEELHDGGHIRAIGVANYSIRHLEMLMRTCRVKPMVNQIEFHPWLLQAALLEYCQKHNIVVQAYGSLGTGDAAMAPQFFELAPVASAARAHDVTPAQVLLRWALQKGVTVIPKSVSEKRQLENAQLDFELTDTEMLAIDDQHRGKRLAWRGKDPDTVL